MEKKFAHCVKQARSSTQEVHTGHRTRADHADTMPRWTFCGDGHLPEAPIRVSGRQIKQIPVDYEPHVEHHVHDADKLYIIVSEGEDGFEAEFTLGDEVYNVKSPATILVPKNVPHTYIPKKGHGFLFMILDIPAKENYNKHTFPLEK